MKKLISYLLLALVLPALGQLKRSDNWHQWRGPEANGVSRSAKPPLTWSETKNIKWKIPLEGRGVSSPIVWGDKIFLLSSVNTGEVDPSLPRPEDQPERVFGIKHPNTKYSFVVICLDRNTGKEIWRRAATDLVPHEGHHKDNSYASASPFTDGKRLYCWFGSAGLYCFDLDGKKLWSRDLGKAKVGASLGEGCSPVVHDGKVVILRDHQGQSTIEALDASTGAPLWKKDRDEPNGWATPLIVRYKGKTQVITSGDNLVRSYDLESGEIIWQCGGLSQNTIPCPVTDGERVYCMSGYSGYSLLALPLSAEGDITGSEEIIWSKSKNTPYIPSPILYDGMLGFLKSNQSFYSVLDAKTGNEVIASTRLPSVANVYSSPVGAAGRIYVTGRNGVTLVLKRGQEFEVLATNKLDDEFRASAALVGSQMILRGSQFLYCIEEGATLISPKISTKPPVAPNNKASKSTRELLEEIAKRELPKDYPGGNGHQAFVDQWFKTADRLMEQVKEVLGDDLERELGGMNLRSRMFNGNFANPEANRLRAQFRKLYYFQESWIPELKKGGIGRVQLYDLSKDPGQKDNIALKRPELAARLKEQAAAIYRSVIADAPEWPAPGELSSAKNLQEERPARPAAKASDKATLLARIDKNPLPKGYHGSRHQAYVDKVLAGLTPEQQALVSQLWKEKRRIDPKMPNRGASFIRILTHVAGGAPAVRNKTNRGSYYVNGEIHVNIYGQPEGKPLTSGHHDFKPSWSKTGDMLVFFRRLKNDPDVSKWKTAIHIINADGSGLHQLTDGTHTDFNQTWTRDGSNTPIWNRKNPKTGGYVVMASKVGAKPGEEFPLTDKGHHTWAYTCLTDGRILVRSNPPGLGMGYYLMTPGKNANPTFERIECELANTGVLDRVSLSPSETRVCFEFQLGFKRRVPGRTLYVADFDAKSRAITNAKPFANEDGKPIWFAYPRWSKDESSIVYQAGGKLYLYNPEDGSTQKVSTNDKADYRYPHFEDAPK